MNTVVLENWEEVVLMRLMAKGQLKALYPNLAGNYQLLRILLSLLVEAETAKTTTVRDRVRSYGLNWSRLSQLGVMERQLLESHEAMAEVLASEEVFKEVQVELVMGGRSGLLERLNQRNGSKEDAQLLIDLLDNGMVRCAEKVRGIWRPQAWVINSMLNYIASGQEEIMAGGCWDKMPLKTAGWDATKLRESGVRYVPGAVVRRGAWLGAGTVVMSQAFVNMGAWVAGTGVMIDTGSRVASAAQIGEGVKLGAGSGLEGVLEPAGRMPTIVEDQARIGAMCEVAGIVQEGAVLASGVVMASGKKIYDQASGKVLPPLSLEVDGFSYQIPVIPAWRLAVGGALLSSDGKTTTDAVILKPGDLREGTTLRHFKRQELLYT